MILNVTEEQKQLIESQGYMVVQFKKWCKDIEPILITFCNRIIDEIELIVTFLKEMSWKVIQVADKILEFGIDIMDKFKPDDDFYIAKTEKFPFIRSIGRKYEPNISNRVIYHRCRDRC